MPHKDDPRGEGLSEISFMEPSDDEDEDALASLSKGLRGLNIKEAAAPRRTEIKVSSATARTFSIQS